MDKIDKIRKGTGQLWYLLENIYIYIYIYIYPAISIKVVSRGKRKSRIRARKAAGNR